MTPGLTPKQEFIGRLVTALVSMVFAVTVVALGTWLFTHKHETPRAAENFGWFSAKKEFLVQDEHGQVYWVEQAQTNSNIYLIWEVVNATNGITNTFFYRMGLHTNGNKFLHEDGTIGITPNL